MRIVVAMSGGVDSSVAAALLAEQGHDVIGLSMQLYDQRGEQHVRTAAARSTTSTTRGAWPPSSAFRTTSSTSSEQFQETVVANFVSEYAAGRTPIPCAHCNSDLKFSTLLDRARGLGADARGDRPLRARRPRRPTGRWLLKRGVDRDKDQSYFLFSLTQEQLARRRVPGRRR